MVLCSVEIAQMSTEEDKNKYVHERLCYKMFSSSHNMSLKKKRRVTGTSRPSSCNMPTEAMWLEEGKRMHLYPNSRVFILFACNDYEP